MQRDFFVDRLRVSSFDFRTEMGRVAAKEATELINGIFKEKDEVNIIFASSPYLMDVYTALLNEDVDWSRVNAFHMDEYIGLSSKHGASFANYVRENFFKKIPLKNAFYMNGLADPVQECERYTDLLEKYPVDITFLGIGTNGHLAFNDPYLADFFDYKTVKINPDLDDVCRQQQVTDGWFETIADIPKSAITITIPALLKAPYIITAVPGSAKKDIVKKTLEGPICVDVPATALRLHKNARLFIDADSTSLLSTER